jgi:hypothetical protein
MSMPRFALKRASKPPTLHKGQETMVFAALAPYPTEQSLEELVERCFERDYGSTLKHQPAPPSEVWASILYHLKRMKEREIVNEIL